MRIRMPTQLGVRRWAVPDQIAGMGGVGSDVSVYGFGPQTRNHSAGFAQRQPCPRLLICL